jgi:hypothetical protein
MSKTPSSAQQLEFVRLRAFITVGFEHVFATRSLSPDHYPAAVADRIWAQSPALALRGLREAASDVVEMLQDLDGSQVAKENPMRMIKSVGLIVLGILLGIAGSTASSRVEAQAPQFIQPGQEVQPGQPVGTIITSENIGFQLIATPANRGDVATGKLMVKVNGRWLPAVAPIGPMPVR